MKAQRLFPWLFMMATPVVVGPALAQQPPARAPAPALRTAPKVGAALDAVKAAQPPAGPGATPDPGAPPGGKRQADTSGLPQFPEEVEFTPRPPGYRVAFSLEDANLSELVRVISQLTGRRFIFGGKIRDIKATVYSPQKVTVAEAYRAFLAILETNGLTVVPQGRFLKIVETPGIATAGTPVLGVGQPVPAEDRYVTRLYRVSHVDAEEVSKLISKFKSKEADVTVYGPGNLLIITDTATNIRRLLRLVEEVDVGGASDKIWVEKINYAVATEVAQKLNEIFDVKGGGAGKPPSGPPGQASGASSSSGPESETRISKIAPEERTNSIVIVATERAYLRILEVIKRLDVQQTGDGDIHVLTLQHAMAEELAQTLNNIVSGIGPQGGGGKPGAARPAGAGGPPEGVFEGSVKVTADKATNSILITSSLRDYAAVRNVIDKLDQPRRQVFIEAVIMNVGVNHTNKFGLRYHGGAVSDGSILFGGLNPLETISTPDPTTLQGLALGVRGKGIDGSASLIPGIGFSIPAFGVIMNAIASSGDVNILSTPHVMATDNVAAELNVGENIPLQTNIGGMSGMPGLGGTAGAAAGMMGGMGMMGMGMGGFSAPRQDIGTKIKVVPHINDSNEVRLELTEEISDKGEASGALGAVPINKRNANTTLVVKDQQTIVIGGLMRDEISTSQTKVPVLGDIPLLGMLFRQSTDTKKKTNLLLVLTPYIVREPNDLRDIFERKMQERQEFLDRYFVFSDQKRYDPPKNFARTNGLLEDVRQAMLATVEHRRLQDESKPKETAVHNPGQPIEYVPGQGGGSGTVDAPQQRTDAPPQGGAPPNAPARRPNPVIVNPINRNVPENPR